MVVGNYSWSILDILKDDDGNFIFDDNVARISNSRTSILVVMKIAFKKKIYFWLRMVPVGTGPYLLILDQHCLDIYVKSC